LLRSWLSVQIDGVLERDPVSFKSHHLLNTLFPDAGMPRSSSGLRLQASNQTSGPRDSFSKSKMPQ
jgi:hypothetical protein